MNIDYARQQMVRQQVRSWEVLDQAVLRVLGEVPRERFVPEGYRSLAFAETAIPIDRGEHMLTPIMEGRILQALDITAGTSVLEVGTGTGFLTACLASLGAEVTSLDIHGAFLALARRNIDDLGYGPIEFLEMDATVSLPPRGFDAIAVTGSLERFDPRFVQALNPGGRLFVVVGAPPAMEARLLVKDGAGRYGRSSVLFETVLQPLVNGQAPSEFSF